MRHIHLLFLLWSGLLSVDSRAQHVSYAPIPSWVRTCPFDLDSVQDRASIQDGTEILLVERQYDLRTRSSFFREVDRLIDPTGVQNDSQLSIRFDPSYEQVTIHAIRIRRNGVVINKLDPAKVQVLRREQDMEEFLYDGSYTAICELDDVRPGDILEESYSITGWSPSFGDHFEESIPWSYGVPIAHELVRVLVPQDRLVWFRSQAGAPPLEEKRTANGSTEYSAEMLQVAAVPDEDDVPPEVMRFGFIEATEFADWDGVRAQCLQLFNVDTILPADLVARVDKLNGIRNALTRADSTWYLVRDGVRYLGLEDGMSAYRPHPPGKVYKQRFGDCKDLALLFVTLSRRCGLRAWPVLVNTVRGHALDQRLARPDVFDHCIAVVECDHRKYWIDPTDSYSYGTVADHHISDYGYCLILDPARKGIDRMPVEVVSGLDVVDRIVLNAVDGPGDLEVTSTFEGALAASLRATLASDGLAQVNERYRKYYAGLYGEVTIKAPLRVTDDRINDRLTLVESYTMNDPWTSIDGDTTNGNVQFRIDPGTLKDHVPLPRQPYRTLPFLLDGPMTLKETFDVTLPEEWSIQREQKDIQGHGVTFSRSVHGYGNGATIEYVYSTTERRIEAGAYSEFQKQQQRINDELTFHFTYRPTVQKRVSTGSTAPHELMHWLLFLAVGVWVGKRMWKYDPPSRTVSWSTGIPIGGWLILPAIGICISVFVVLYLLMKEDMAMLFLTDTLPTISDGHPVLAHAYVYTAQLLMAVKLVFLPVLCVLFFQKRSSVPTLMIILYVWRIAELIFEAFCYHALDLERFRWQFDYGDIVRALVPAAIWVPYFIASSRVKDTFIRRRVVQGPLTTT